MNPDRIALIEQGPFPGRVDPWSEHPTYFHSMHGSMIDGILDLIHEPLLQRGYFAARERSLQILEGRVPDVFIREQKEPPMPARTLDYELAAAEVLADPGIAVADGYDLDALHIRSNAGDLVTVVEVVSPSNKMRSSEIDHYRERRSRLFIEQSVHVVEIDLTRSIRRLIGSAYAGDFPYHIALFLAADLPRVIGIALTDSLPVIALPLREQVIPVALQRVYARAYAKNSVALQIWRDDGYHDEKLPFPSLMSQDDRTAAQAAVKSWAAKLST